MLIIAHIQSKDQTPNKNVHESDLVFKHAELCEGYICCYVLTTCVSIITLSKKMMKVSLCDHVM